MSFARWYVKYHAVSVVFLLPAYAINLGVVGVFVLFHQPTFWVLSSVVIGDIVAYEVNLAMSVFVQAKWKYLQRLQLQRPKI